MLCAKAPTHWAALAKAPLPAPPATSVMISSDIVKRGQLPRHKPCRRFSCIRFWSSLGIIPNSQAAKVYAPFDYCESRPHVSVASDSPPTRRFPPPWSTEEQLASFIVGDMADDRRLRQALPALLQPGPYLLKATSWFVQRCNATTFGIEFTVFLATWHAP